MLFLLLFFLFFQCVSFTYLADNMITTHDHREPYHTRLISRDRRKVMMREKYRSFGMSWR